MDTQETDFQYELISWPNYIEKYVRKSFLIYAKPIFKKQIYIASCQDQPQYSQFYLITFNPFVDKVSYWNERFTEHLIFLSKF